MSGNVWPLVVLSLIYGLLLVMMSIIHRRAEEDWFKERRQLLDRIMATDFREYAAVQAVREPTEEERELMEANREKVETFMREQYPQGGAEVGAE